MRFTFKKLEIPEVLLIEHEAAGDDRGFFSEVYREKEFAEAGIRGPFVQDNHSRSERGVLRGLHLQAKPRGVAKIVRCAAGEIFDVAVDLRKGSPTFGKWVGATLSDKNRAMMYIPEGFAHGFAVLSDSADVCYKQTGYYSREHDGGVLWSDPEIGIRWPLAQPKVSEKDARLPRLKELKSEY